MGLIGEREDGGKVGGMRVRWLVRGIIPQDQVVRRWGGHCRCNGWGQLL